MNMYNWCKINHIESEKMISKISINLFLELALIHLINQRLIIKIVIMELGLNWYYSEVM